jgi:hypothetical protein
LRLQQWDNLLAEPVAKIATLRLELFDALTTRELRPSWHIVLVWRTYQFEDDLRLVKVRFALKNRPAFEHLGKHTASSPHVYCRGVSSELQEKLWGAVPSGYNKCRVVADCLSIASAGLRYRAVVVTSQTKIGNLE